jgi:hypothetical protein
VRSPTQEQSGYRFVIGLLAGACVGAGLTLWIAPRSAATRPRSQDVPDDVALAVAVLENEGNPPTAVQASPAALGRDSSRNDAE